MKLIGADFCRKVFARHFPPNEKPTANSCRADFLSANRWEDKTGPTSSELCGKFTTMKLPQRIELRLNW